MLDNAPRESELRSWGWVMLGIAVIYATIPMARWLRGTVDSLVGREIFIVLTLAVIAVAALVAVRNLRRRGLPASAYLGLTLSVGAFFALILSLRAIPEEAIHVAEYGGLGMLIYRALLHRVRDYSIYLLAAILTGLVGVIDEYVQWVVPSRYYDVRDILLNLTSAILGQVIIVAGLRPALIRGWPGARSLGRLCVVSALAATVLAVGFINTPQRVAWYAERISGLEFLLDGTSMMAQYGYLHGDASPRFRSRFDLEELARLDRERGAEVAAILDRYIRNEGYRAFLVAHNEIRDPYAHEAGVHLFRREYYFDRARENLDDVDDHYAIAFNENRILEQYYPTALAQSRFPWSAATRSEFSARTDSAEAYLSPVSAALITRLGEKQVMTGFVIAIMLLLSTGVFLARRAPGQER